MQTGYFSVAWNDIKNSPGWLGKLAVLSLVGLIPIFGWIVVCGYLFGWARDIAWNVHTPMPAHVFGNEDGKLYSRGFFACIISIIPLIVPWALEMVWGLISGFGLGWSAQGGHPGVFAFFGLTSAVFSLAIFAATLVAVLFVGVGSMRMSVYGRLAPGLQFGKLWAMMRHDFRGLLRILGMGILLSIAMGLIISLLMVVLVFIGLAVGFAVTGGNLNTDFGRGNGAVLGMILSVSGLVLVLGTISGLVTMAISVFSVALVTRALGYWTRQFDVPQWRGQDDPMPFELVGAASPYRQQPPNDSSTGWTPPRQ